MITIPTSELLGLLTDVSGFADPDKDGPHYGVLLSWRLDVVGNGTLTAAAYHVLAGAEATWFPGEGAEAEPTGDREKIDAEQVEWGDQVEPSDPWSAFIDSETVAQIVKVFKVPAAYWRLPLTLHVTPVGSRLTIERSGEWGRPAQSITVRVDPDRTRQFPSIQETLASHVPASSVGQRYWSHTLGLLGTVRSHAELQMIPGAQGHPTALAMGRRWTGFVWPATDLATAQARRAELLA